VEMTELDSILKRITYNGENTLIIGDEVCRGTNDEDAQSLVSAALVRLSEANSTYIFSSHLHKLPHIPEIIALKNLRLYHLLVEYDADADCLVFDRRLVHGSGPHSYALIVAKYIIKDRHFINIAETIKQRLTGELVNIPIKKSKFNKLLLAKMCAICYYVPILSYHKELETHHIHFQSKCLPDGKIIDQKHLSKDELYNLVILCRHCHEDVHKNYIKIHGYIDTSIGPILDYQIDIQSKINNDFKLIENLDKKCCKK
jgi:DNA mismatch repair protein MutS